MAKRAPIFKFIKFGFCIAVLCLLYGFFVEPKTLAIRHVTITSQNWHGPPIKIGLMSDVHIGGRHVDAARVERIVRKINEMSPDIVLLAGDYVNGHMPHTESSKQFNLEFDTGIGNLGKLSAPLGVFAVLGNHDAWYGETHVLSLLRHTNIEVLNNQSTIIETTGEKFCLVGLADSFTGVPDRTVFSECGTGINIIAFTHSPDSFNLLRSDTSLALAGHTHGGQINIPLIGRRVTATKSGPKYAYGKIEVSGFPGFVTSGIGTSILPARFRAPPEIVIITLRSP